MAVLLLNFDSWILGYVSYNKNSVKQQNQRESIHNCIQCKTTYYKSTKKNQQNFIQNNRDKPESASTI